MISQTNQEEQEKKNPDTKVRFGISYKLATLVAVAGVLPVIIMGIFVYLNTSSIILQQRQDRLSMLVFEKKNTLIMWFDEIKDEISLLGENLVEQKDIIEALKKSTNVRGRDAARDTTFVSFLKVHEGFKELSLIDPQTGIILLSSDKAMEGTRDMDFDVLEAGRNLDSQKGSVSSPERVDDTAGISTTVYGQKIYYSPKFHEHFISIFSSVQDESGNVLVIVRGTVTLSGINKILMVQSTTYGKDTKVYLISRDGHLLTHDNIKPKEDNHVELSSTSLAIDDIRVGKSGAGRYLDYEGKEVFGAYDFISDFNAGIIIETPATEVFAVLKTIKNWFFLGFGVLVLVGMVFFIFATKIVANPIKKLTRFVSGINVKDEKNVLPLFTITSRDEIGLLAGAFNRMIAHIYESQYELEKKVKEKTAALAESLKNTEEQNKVLEESKTATLNVLEDAWELKEKFEAQRNELQSIISSIGEGLILVNRDHVVTLANPMAEKILDISLKDLVGKKAHDLVQILKKGKEIPYEDRPMVRVLATKQSLDIGLEDDYSFRVPSGKEFPVAISITPLIKDDILGAIVVFRDISKEKALDESKSSFISIASHQLRTPLTSIRWYSEMLLSEDAGPLNKEQKDFAFEVNDGTLRLYNTIDLLLSLSRIENGTLKHSSEKVNLGKLMNEVVEELKPQLAPKSLTLNVILPEGTMPDIDLDPLLMRQVFLNLIANSIRYTNNGGVIEAKIEKRDGEFLCYVRDNGIGIPEAEKPKIFSKFFRAQNALEKIPDGSGLGLSLVKGLVESWGGRVWFESEEGKGTTFYFVVPEHPAMMQKKS